MEEVVDRKWIRDRIHYIRGLKIMLSSDLAEIYGVQTKVLLQSVKRNSNRFPDDFMFKLAPEEVRILRSQIVTSSWGGPRYEPYAFTEQGIAMLSSVLRSDRAIQVNIAITREFVAIRKFLISHQELSMRLDRLEERYDKQFKSLFDAFRSAIAMPEPKKRPIGIAGVDEE